MLENQHLDFPRGSEPLQQESEHGLQPNIFLQQYGAAHDLNGGRSSLHVSSMASGQKAPTTGIGSKRVPTQNSFGDPSQPMQTSISTNQTQEDIIAENYRAHISVYPGGGHG
mmetsp:Transcript_23973/g.36767  ORF Transcript_23973/g.36767 Transcript_23973/m.36767 type:complete len:112 (-) Transcript_23973:231-566(-)